MLAAIILACLVSASQTASAARVLFREHTIRTGVFTVSSLYAADLDGDGDVDLLSSATPADEIAWYERRGPNARPFFVSHVISGQARGALSVFAADVDGDGDLDVLSASSGDFKIAWYENDGLASPSFTEHVVSTSAFWASSVFAIDLDGDTDTDLLSASTGDDKIAWYENNGGLSPAFVEHVITMDPDGFLGPLQGMADWPLQAAGGDLDGDGDGDVIVVANAADHFYWFENDGGAPPQFTPRIVEETAWAQRHLNLVDMDGDGDLDIIANSGYEHRLALFENDGGAPHGFTIRPVWEGEGEWAPFSHFPADFDNDGDLDILTPAPREHRTLWFVNNGGAPPVFTPRVLVDGLTAHRVYAADLDGDGDMDPVASFSDRIVWYENRVLRPHGTLGRPLPMPRELQGWEVPVGRARQGLGRSGR
jgi:hypothetical protein